jgi:plasmid stability protein
VGRETYRYLLRIPDELRQRLVESAVREGRSFNAEVRHRLEQSLERDEQPARRARFWAASSRRGELVVIRPKRLALAAGIVLAGTAAIVGAALVGSGSPTAGAPQVGNGELPTIISKYQEAVQGYADDQEGPASAADFEFAHLAYPNDTVSLEQMATAREAFSKASKRAFKGKAMPGEWVSVGPSRALYPLTQFRNSGNYVPNEYVAGGRTTSIAIRPSCQPGECRAWITPAGGGVWRTNDILADNVKWTYLGGPLGINAAGIVYLDPNDPNENTVYVGTGEANICGSGCVAGTGLYKSVNGGQTWTLLGQAEKFAGKGIGSIAVKPGDPNTIYAGTTTALRGMSSVCCSGVTRPVPGIAKWGLYKSTDGGATWSFIHNGSTDVATCTGDATEFSNQGVCSPRGVRQVLLDPSNPDIVYASSYARGIWRSSDAGATWAQIKPSINPALIQSRAAMAVTTLPNGKTRMYVHEGNNNTQGQITNANSSRFFRSDDVSTGAPVYTDLSSSNIADPGWAFRGLCDPQCWYDIFIYTPPGHPDMVYVGGDYFYNERIANKRAVILSTDAGVTGTDMTFDGTDPVHPNGIHPDQHFLVTNPNNPFQFIESGDGGVIRSSGELVDRSSWCDSRGFRDPVPPATGPTAAQQLARCKQMLSAIPSKLDSINPGLSTLQFQSLSVSPHDVNELQGGTQDNGTWENYGSTETWQNTMIGDGGQSGFDVGIPAFRFHTFTGPAPDVNFNNGNIADWIFSGGPLGGAANRVSEFYSPVISDPVVSKMMFTGTGLTAYRTKTATLGTRTVAEANAICNEWTGTGSPPGNFSSCGDWERLGPTPLTDASWGDRGDPPPPAPTIAVAAIERTKADMSTAWAATTSGRVFISKNVDADPASAVTWTRIDDDSAIDPNRYVSSIYVDPANGNHAWISYSGFGANTPATPGHVFEVTYNPASTTATWTDLSHDMQDIPVTDLVRDDVTGNLYASNDFGVLVLAAGTSTWTLAAPGMPNVEVAGLTVVPSERILYAATHGLGAWKLTLG